MINRIGRPSSNSVDHFSTTLDSAVFTDEPTSKAPEIDVYIHGRIKVVGGPSLHPASPTPPVLSLPSPLGVRDPGLFQCAVLHKSAVLN